MTVSSECRNCAGAAHEFYACLLHEQRSRLEGAALPHVYEARESVFHEGTPPLAVYCVQSGTLKLFRRLRHGEEMVVGLRGPGELAGLRGVLAGIPYGSTAQALERSTVCAIPAEVLLSLVRENATLGCRLLRRLARESRRLEEAFAERTHSRVRQRAAHVLADRCEARAGAPAGTAPLSLSIRREELAVLIGTTPETLSRTLHAFAGEGLLRLDRREIRVLDLAALRRVAG